MSAANIWVLRDGNRYGPYSRESAFGALQRGELKKLDEVLVGKAGNPKRLRELLSREISKQEEHDEDFKTFRSDLTQTWESMFEEGFISTKKPTPEQRAAILDYAKQHPAICASGDPLGETLEAILPQLLTELFLEEIEFYKHRGVGSDNDVGRPTEVAVIARAQQDAPSRWSWKTLAILAGVVLATAIALIVLFR